jgi:hypothetical protein
MEMNEAVKILYENGYRLEPKINEKLAGSTAEKYEIDKIKKYMEKLGYLWDFNEHSNYFAFCVPYKGPIVSGNLIPWAAYVISKDGKFYFGRSLKDWKKDMRTLGII